MAALLVNIINLVNSMIIKRFSNQDVQHKHSSKKSEEHSKYLTRPSIYHKVLDDEFVNSFDEIFIIGDVHACYDEMIEIINQIESTKESPSTKILKIFVGDLINKGPKNVEVIDYMMSHQEDCLSVRGNHEEIAIKIAFVERNGGKLKKSMAKYKWAKDLTDTQLNYMTELPYTISLNTSSNETAIIVHAGLVAGLPLEKHDPYDIVHMRNIIIEDYYDGRGIHPIKSNSYGSPWCEYWPGPAHVYFGHNSKLGFQKCQFATGLDTGCVKGNLLTGIFIKGPRKGKIVEVKSNQRAKIKRRLDNEFNDATVNNLKGSDSNEDSSESS